MVILVELIGIIIVGFGIAYFVNPKIVKIYGALCANKKRTQAAAGVNVVFGVLLLLAASQCAVPWFVVLMGIISLAKGIYIFAIGPKGLALKLDWWLKRPPAAVRLYAVIAIVVGAFLIFSA